MVKNAVRDNFASQYQNDINNGMNQSEASQKYSDAMKRLQNSNDPGMFNEKIWDKIKEKYNQGSDLFDKIKPNPYYKPKKCP